MVVANLLVHLNLFYFKLNYLWKKNIKTLEE